LARGTCAKIRNLMSVLFNHARRHKLFDDNPITLVRQSSKRRKIPQILTVDELQRLLAVLQPLYRVLAFTDATTGLRQSELFGLKWSDVDLDSGQINVVRSVVHGVVSPCKTESSLKPIPMAPGLANLLKEWKSECRYTAPDDWVFASKRSRGKRPMWGENMIRKPIRRAAQSLGIFKTFGWHAFRHSYSTMLRFLGVDIKVQQDLLRHSSARLTLDTYTQAITPAKRDAQDRVIQLLVGAGVMHLSAPMQCH
jgi:integrase